MLKTFGKTYIAALLSMVIMLSGCITIKQYPAGTYYDEPRLVGKCSGRIILKEEEDEFPAGCDWIEPINWK